MPDNDPQVAWVDVPRRDVTLTLDDLLKPLISAHARYTGDNPPHPLDPAVEPEVAKLSELAGTLRDVVQRIDQLQPEILRRPADPPPRTA